jgi:hypothetical protein
MLKFFVSHITKVILLAAFSLVVLLSFLNLHGFSDAMWDKLAPQQSGLTSKIIRGAPQPIRSDDWAVNLPLIKSQLVHEPKFPVINTLIGDGQNMLIITNAPVAHWITFFRPASWGWFISEDFGIAWFWWLRIFVVFAGFFLLFKELSKSVLVGVFAGTSIVFAPISLYWSFLVIEVAGFSALAIFATIKILKEVNWARLLGWTSLLSYVATAGVYQMYPPSLISVVWAGVFILGSWCASHRHELISMPLRINLKRLAAIVLGALIAISLTLALFVSIGEAYTLITNTVYPGQRSLTGGTGTIMRILINLVSLQRVDGVDRLTGNICEASGYLFLFPFSLIIGATYFAKFRKIPLDFVVLVLGNLFFLAWFFVGFPEFLSKITGFSKVPSTRSQIGLLMLDTALLICTAKLAKALWNKDKAAVAVSSAIWSVLLASAFLYLKKMNVVTHYHYGFYQPMIVILVISGLFYWKPIFSFLGFALLGIYNNASFNPIQVGSTKLATSSFGQALLDAESQTSFERTTDSVLIFGSIIGNAPRTMGMKSVGGTLFYPQPSWLLRLGLDPKDPIVNRYANIFVEMSPANTSQIIAVSPQADVIVLRVNPNSEQIAKMGVNLIGVGETERHFISTDRFAPASQGGGYYFYIRK